MRYPHNMHYLDRYVRFILNCQRTNVGLKNYETHHICPKGKHMFPEFKNLKENHWNAVNLTYRQHYIAHWILSKVYNTGDARSSAQKAFWYMTIRLSINEHRHSRIYEYAKLANSQAMRQNNPMKSEETKAKMKEGRKRFLESDKGYEYRKIRSAQQTGVNNITEKGYESLRNRWLGVKRPKSEAHISNNRIAQSKGIWKTPFGQYYSPGEGERCENNIEKLSRYIIDKKCREGNNGFVFYENS